VATPHGCFVERGHILVEAHATLVILLLTRDEEWDLPANQFATRVDHTRMSVGHIHTFDVGIQSRGPACPQPIMSKALQSARGYTQTRIIIIIHIIIVSSHTIAQMTPCADETLITFS